jgi:predicted DNA-binding transcriptional regulator AlpA
MWLPDAAEYLGYAIDTLRRWRVKKKGPASFRVGGKVAYRQAVLDAWLAHQEASDPHSNPELRESSAPVEHRISAAA